MADPRITNQIANIKKLIADAEKNGNAARVATLKNQLDVLMTNAIRAKKLRGTQLSTEGKKYQVGQTFKITPIKSIMSFTAYNPNPAEAEIDEAKGFVKYLAKKLKSKYGSRATKKAEEAWKKAKKSYDTSSDYEKIAGTAKIIAANMLKSRKKKVTEDGAGGVAPIAASPQTGMIGTTMTSDIAPFAAKLGEKPNIDSEGKYKADPGTMFRRKVKPTKPPKQQKKKKEIFGKVKPTKPPRNESVENYIDNLFE